MKKKLVVLLTTAMVAASLAACGQSNGNTGNSESTDQSASSSMESTEISETVPESITITSLNGNKEEVEVTIPYDPGRIAILDLAALDIIDNIGMGDRVVGSADTSIDYLSDYADNEDIVNLGTIKEADLEAVMACEPEVIFIGGRLSASYNALSEIAPVVYLETDTEVGLVESVSNNAKKIASLFGLESEIDEKMAGFSERIAALQEVAEGKTALVGMTTSGSFNLLGNDGRCSIIGVEVGFNNLTASSSDSSEESGRGQGLEGAQSTEATQSKETSGQGSGAGSPHGNEASFETVVAENPDYIFVMDRDSAIGTEGAQLAKEIMENELVMGTDAYKNGNIVYLENPAVWYTAEGGITSLDTMLSDLEHALLN